MGKNVDDAGVFFFEYYDCIPHDLIMAKLEVYGIHIDTIKLIHGYFSNRKQRVKVNAAYSLWKDIFYGVWQ